MTEFSSQTRKCVVVIGAGVVGLTTALRILETGNYEVSIIAEVLPSDSKTIKYTSHWAGAHHVSIAGDDLRQRGMDRETFDVMWELSAPGAKAEKCFMRLPQTEYFNYECTRPHPLDVMPDFKYLEESALPLGILSGVAFTTVTIDVPIYLNYLLSRFLAAGGSIVRGSVQHINEIIEGGTRVFSRARNLSPLPDAIVVCAGLGARSLGGVEDKDMLPIRGQTVLLRAPWVKFGVTVSDGGDLWTYVIPRRSGDVIVGGTKVKNDWFPNPRAEITTDILRRALALCPELAPPEIRQVREPTVDDLSSIIIEEGCGLRPGRKGGIRVEVEWFDAITKTDKIPVVYNYGHGGYGYQSSWGSASLALEMLNNALAGMSSD